MLAVQSAHASVDVSSDAGVIDVDVAICTSMSTTVSVGEVGVCGRVDEIVGRVLLVDHCRHLDRTVHTHIHQHK